jgi:hypothetical protein
VSKPIERQIRCWHCEGACQTPSGSSCPDCGGDGTLCPLCGKSAPGATARSCECPDGHFVGEFAAPEAA